MQKEIKLVQFYSIAQDIEQIKEIKIENNKLKRFVTFHTFNETKLLNEKEESIKDLVKTKENLVAIKKYIFYSFLKEQTLYTNFIMPYENKNVLMFTQEDLNFLNIEKEQLIEELKNIVEKYNIKNYKTLFSLEKEEFLEASKILFKKNMENLPEHYHFILSLGRYDQYPFYFLNLFEI